MADDNNDVLMMFNDSNNAPVAADCRVTVEAGDPMAKGFAAGCFFEVQDFGFGVGLQDTDPQQAAAQKPAPGKAAGAQAAANQGKGKGKGKDEDDTPKQKATFTAWRYPDPRTKQAPYPLDLQPFQFSRAMDRASTTLFSYCASSRVFRSAALIKRTIVGHGKGLMPFLRIDFSDVLVIGVDWDDGDVVKETCKFMARKVEVTYKPQQPDGSLGDKIPGRWDINETNK